MQERPRNRSMHADHVVFEHVFARLFFSALLVRNKPKKWGKFKKFEVEKHTFRIHGTKKKHPGTPWAWKMEDDVLFLLVGDFLRWTNRSFSRGETHVGVGQFSPHGSDGPNALRHVGFLKYTWKKCRYQIHTIHYYTFLVNTTNSLI